MTGPRPGPRPVLGLVLAGGLGRRMGGQDKAGLSLGGTTFGARALARLAPQCTACLVNLNGPPERFGSLGAPVVADGIGGFAGPLAGILAGLDWAAAHRPDLADVVSVAVDTPFLPPDLAERLWAARAASGAPLACARSGGRYHPVAALWPVRLRADLRAALEAGERKIDRWTMQHGLAIAEWPAEPVDPFFNVNTPADLAEAGRLAAAAGET